MKGERRHDVAHPTIMDRRFDHRDIRASRKLLPGFAQELLTNGAG
jgi:hypothetical protein